MRIVRVEKDEFDNFLYPAITQSTARSEAELEVAIRVLRKLNEISTPDVITPQQREAAAMSGQVVRPMRKMTEAVAGLSLEEDEFHLVAERLIAVIPRINLIGAEEYYAFFTRFRNAPRPEQLEVREKVPRIVPAQ